MKIYTRVYNAFSLGPAHSFIATEALPIASPLVLGKGISVVPIQHPDGRLFWAESRHGSLHGTDLARIRADVADVPSDILTDQLEQSKKDRARAKEVPAVEFWALLR